MANNHSKIQTKTSESAMRYMADQPSAVLEVLNIHKGDVENEQDLEILKLVDRTLERHGAIIRGLRAL